MLNRVDLTATLKKIPWFLELSPDSLNRLADLADLSSIHANEVIFAEGDQHPFLHIIISGKVRLESFVPGYGSLPYCTVEPLEVIGCSSLTPVVRQKTSTARSMEQTTLLSFKADSLKMLCESDCDLGFIFMRRIANIVASRMLNQRLHLLKLLTGQLNQP